MTNISEEIFKEIGFKPRHYVTDGHHYDYFKTIEDAKDYYDTCLDESDREDCELCLNVYPNLKILENFIKFLECLSSWKFNCGENCIENFLEAVELHIKIVKPNGLPSFTAIEQQALLSADWSY